MPKYSNSLATAVVGDGIRVEPKSKESTVVWFNSVPAGITKDSDSPFYNPIISSELVSGTKTITVDTSLTGNYQVEIYCITGSISIQYNSSDAVARILGAGDKTTEMCGLRTINTIIITISSGTATVTVKKC